MFWKITCTKPCKYQQILTFASSFATSQQMLKHWYLQRFWTMIVAKNCYFWSVFPQISCGRYPPNSSKFLKPHFLLTCTYFRGRRHGRNLPMAKATDGLAFGITRHCRIKGYRPCRRPLSKQGVKMRGAAQAPATLNKRSVTLHKRVCNAEQACVQRWTSVLERCTSVFATLHKRFGTLHKRVCNAEQATYKVGLANTEGATHKWSHMVSCRPNTLFKGYRRPNF